MRIRFFNTLCSGLNIVGALALSALGAPAHADGLLRVQQTVFGMDCAPCAYSVQHGLEKLPGVLDAKVSLNDGQAVIRLAPVNSVTLADIQTLIRHNGFTPKNALITIVGSLSETGGHYYLLSSGGARYALQTTKPGVLSALTSGEKILVEGRVAAFSTTTLEVMSAAKFTPATPAGPH